MTDKKPKPARPAKSAHHTACIRQPMPRRGLHKPNPPKKT